MASTPTLVPHQRPRAVTTFRAHRRAQVHGAAGVEQRVDQRGHLVALPGEVGTSLQASGRRRDRGRPAASGSSSVTRSRAVPRAAASSGSSQCTTPLDRACMSGPPRAVASTCSPVAARTTSGPVTKTRLSGPETTRSVSAGAYAAPPAHGPSTTEIRGTHPRRRHQRLEDPSDTVERRRPVLQARASRVPDTDDGIGLTRRASYRPDDHLAGVGVHRATGDARVAREQAGAHATDQGGPGPDADARLPGVEVQRTGVGQQLQPVLRGRGHAGTVAAARHTRVTCRVPR